MQHVRVKVGEGGRIVIPAEHRHALGPRIGDEVMVRLEDGELRLSTWRQAVKRAREIARRHVPQGVVLSDELIAERRAEAARK